MLAIINKIAAVYVQNYDIESLAVMRLILTSTFQENLA